MNSISIRSINASEASDRAPDIAQLYASVFSTPPWNEAFKCSSCNASFGADAAGSNCCGTPLDAYYPIEETAKDIAQYMSMTKSRMVLALDSADREQPVGFAWGWEDTIAGLNEKKFGLNDEDVARLCERSGFDVNDPLFYFSELGVLENQRGNGIGRKMTNYLFSVADHFKAKGLIMRTSRNSSAYSIVTNPTKDPILKVAFEYRDALERVILSLPRPWKPFMTTAR